MQTTVQYGTIRSMCFLDWPVLRTQRIESTVVGVMIVLLYCRYYNISIYLYVVEVSGWGQNDRCVCTVLLFVMHGPTIWMDQPNGQTGSAEFCLGMYVQKLKIDRVFTDGKQKRRHSHSRVITLYIDIVVVCTNETTDTCTAVLRSHSSLREATQQLYCSPVPLQQTFIAGALPDGRWMPLISKFIVRRMMR